MRAGRPASLPGNNQEMSSCKYRLDPGKTVIKPLFRDSNEPLVASVAERQPSHSRPHTKLWKQIKTNPVTPRDQLNHGEVGDSD